MDDFIIKDGCETLMIHLTPLGLQFRGRCKANLNRRTDIGANFSEAKSLAEWLKKAVEKFGSFDCPVCRGQKKYYLRRLKGNISGFDEISCPMCAGKWSQQEDEDC